MKFKNNNFKLVEDIADFGIRDPIATKVKEFYEEYPFPNYKVDDNKYTLSQSGDKNSFSKKLKDFIGFDKSILEVGSGTSQLSNYLAIGTNNRVCAFDTSMKSLKIVMN